MTEEGKTFGRFLQLSFCCQNFSFLEPSPLLALPRRALKAFVLVMVVAVMVVPEPDITEAGILVLCREECVCWRLWWEGNRSVRQEADRN